MMIVVLIFPVLFQLQFRNQQYFAKAYQQKLVYIQRKLVYIEDYQLNYLKD